MRSGRRFLSGLPAREFRETDWFRPSSEDHQTVGQLVGIPLSVWTHGAILTTQFVLSISLSLLVVGTTDFFGGKCVR